MAIDTLIGFDGKAARATLGSSVTTGTLVAGSQYVVTVLGGSSALPTGAAVGYVFTADGTEDITSSGDEVKLFTVTDMGEITKWEIDLSATDVDITKLADLQNKYRAGRPDFSGSLEGIFTIGQTDSDGGVANTFVDIVSQADDGGALTINSVDNSSIILILTAQKSTASGETVVEYFVPAVLLNFRAGAEKDGAQTWTSGFRLTEHDDLYFQMYEKVIA